jgi:hypothetical protein
MPRRVVGDPPLGREVEVLQTVKAVVHRLSGGRVRAVVPGRDRRERGRDVLDLQRARVTCVGVRCQIRPSRARAVVEKVTYRPSTEMAGVPDQRLAWIPWESRLTSVVVERQGLGDALLRVCSPLATCALHQVAGQNFHLLDHFTFRGAPGRLP